MKVVILCGGLGTRLREESEYRPKPLVEIGGRPILWHIMKLYAHHGFRDFTLCLGYKGNMIKEYFLNYEAMNNNFTISLGKESSLAYKGIHEEQDFKVTLMDTGMDSLTGSRIKRIEKEIDEDTFMVTYGDGVSNVNIEKLLAFHRAHGRIATVTSVHPVSRFGLMDIDAENSVREFAEKPLSDGWANAGFFVFQKEIFQYLDENPHCILEDTPLKKLAADGQLMAYQHDGFFYAMDTYREYLHLNELWNSNKAEWAVWKKEFQHTL